MPSCLVPVGSRCALLLAVLVSSTSAAAQEPAAPDAAERSRLLVLDLAANGVEEDVVRTISGVLAVELSTYDELDVLTSDDIRRTLELEVQRHTAGCEDASCL